MPGKVAAGVRRKKRGRLAVEDEEADRLRAGQPASLAELGQFAVKPCAPQIRVGVVQRWEIEIGDLRAHGCAARGYVTASLSSTANNCGAPRLTSQCRR